MPFHQSRDGQKSSLELLSWDCCGVLKLVKRHDDRRVPFLRMRLPRASVHFPLCNFCGLTRRSCSEKRVCTIGTSRNDQTLGSGEVVSSICIQDTKCHCVNCSERISGSQSEKISTTLDPSLLLQTSCLSKLKDRQRATYRFVAKSVHTDVFAMQL